MENASISSSRAVSAGHQSRLLPVITGIFAATLIISSVAATKIVSIGPFTLPGGTILFPILFIFNDILTEVYGYSKSRMVIWTGLAAQAFAAIVLYVVDILPAAPFWHNQQAFHEVLGFVPRIAVAGLVAFFIGEMANSYVMSKMKYAVNGRRGLHQGWRYVASTIVGEAIDSIVVMVIAFGGVIPMGDLLKTIITLYLVKVSYEIVALPISIPFANWLKKIENVDRIDTPETTNYNPFDFSDRS